MKILKNGNFKVPETVCFTCDICGCEFIAEDKNGEFDWEVKILGWQSLVVYSAICPCCDTRTASTKAIRNFTGYKDTNNLLFEPFDPDPIGK